VEFSTEFLEELETKAHENKNMRLMLLARVLLEIHEIKSLLKQDNDSSYGGN
jgi:hypothetical protein